MIQILFRKVFLPAAIPAAVFFSACENDMADVNEFIQIENLPSETGKNIELVYSDSGEVQMMLTAPVMDHYSADSNYIELPEGVKVLFYDSLKQVTSTITADYAINHESQKVMEAKNNVVVVNNKGERLNTEHLIWDAEKAIIHTNKPIRITTEDEIIMGEGLEADQSFSRYKIHKVTGTLTLEENDQNTENP